VEGRAPALAREMHVDGEKAGSAVQGFPLGDERLAAGGPGGVQRVDQARVIFQGWARQYLVGGCGCAGVGRAQAQDGRVVEVGGSDVAAWLATVGVVGRVDGSEGVGDRWVHSIDGAREG
jgi:hypothetical protein